MDFKFIRRLAACAFLVAPLSAMAGAPQVGDSVQLQYVTVDGAKISADQLKGKIVVVDFWATWCGPCMAEAEHMVDLNKKYGPKGLQMLGVSLDSDRAAMQQVAKQKGFAWPQYFDGQGWKNKLAQAWGVDSIPRTFLIGADGKLAWTGHPAQIDAEIEKAFKQHPPQLIDPKVLAQASQLLDDVSTKVKAGDTRGAIKVMAKVPAPALADEKMADRAATARKELEEAADAMLAEAQPLIDKGDYPQAVTKLREVSDALSGSPVATKAKRKLGELLNKPEAKAALAAADKNAKANEALAGAKKLQADKKQDQAYLRFKAIATDYSGTAAATAAEEQVKNYEKDPAFVKRVNESAAAGKARSALALAQSYRRAGSTELARKKYQSVIDQFPGTSYAEKARQEMQTLDQ